MKYLNAPFITFEPGESDISEICNKTFKLLLKTKKNIAKVYVKDETDPKEMLKFGFILASAFFTNFSPTRDVLVARYIEKLNDDEMFYWGIDTVYLHPSEHISYLYANIEGWREFALTNCISLPLFLFAPELLYQSGRPKTCMSMFRQPSSISYTKIISPSPVNKFSFYIETSTRNVVSAIPVSRYAYSMLEGLYFDNDDEDNKSDFLGTFYYYELESTTYLTSSASSSSPTSSPSPTSSTLRIYRNKYEAIRSLYDEFCPASCFYGSYMNTLSRKYFEHPEEFPTDLKMTPMEFEKYNPGHFLNRLEWYFPEKDYPTKISALPNRKRYIGNNMHLYALEDEYDQKICKIAKDNGIDIIIFTHMAGKYQIITEILDTRDRLTSFNNLCYLS